MRCDHKAGAGAGAGAGAEAAIASGKEGEPIGWGTKVLSEANLQTIARRRCVGLRGKWAPQIPIRGDCAKQPAALPSRLAHTVRAAMAASICYAKISHTILTAHCRAIILLQCSLEDTSLTVILREPKGDGIRVVSLWPRSSGSFVYFISFRNCPWLRQRILYINVMKKT